MDVIGFIKNSIKLYFDKKFESYDYIDKKMSWLEVFGIFIVIMLLSFFISMFLDNSELVKVFGDVYGYSLFFFILIFIIFIIVIFIFLSYGFLHLLFKLFKGKGSFKDTFKFGMSTSIFPSIVFFIIGLLPIMFVSENLYVVVFMSIFFFIISVCFFIWSIYVSVKIYSRVHKISFFKSLVVMLIPLFLLILLFFIISLLLYIASVSYQPYIL